MLPRENLSVNFGNFAGENQATNRCKNMTSLAYVKRRPSPALSIHPFINTHKAAVIIKYKNTQSTMNRKIYKRNKIKMNERVLPVIKAVQIEHTTNE